MTDPKNVNSPELILANLYPDFLLLHLAIYVLLLCYCLCYDCISSRWSNVAVCFWLIFFIFWIYFMFIFSLMWMECIKKFSHAGSYTWNEMLISEKTIFFHWPIVWLFLLRGESCRLQKRWMWMRIFVYYFIYFLSYK